MGRRNEGISPKKMSGAVPDESSCVAEVMGTELFTLTPDTVVGSALRLAATRRIRHFLVIDEGNLTGIVADDDLQQARETTLVGECMSTPVLCIGPETTLGEAVEIMDENAVGCLPVVTGAFLVGVITRDRLLRAGVADKGLEGEEAAPCGACGSTQDVRRELRTGMLALCEACTAIMPTVEPPRGN